jgi:hypothetical protein
LSNNSSRQIREDILQKNSRWSLNHSTVINVAKEKTVKSSASIYNSFQELTWSVGFLMTIDAKRIAGISNDSRFLQNVGMQ